MFNRICGDIKYFAELYLELRTTYDYESLIFNKLLDQNQQYLLIMSAMIYFPRGLVSLRLTGLRGAAGQFRVDDAIDD